jgi:superfamily II RNA helicase
LNAGEFTQLTGRAGRRGLDSEGHAIVAFAQETSMLDIGRVAVAGAPELHSSFRPTYNFTANLMHHVDRERAEEILRLSYAQFEADRRTQGPRRSLVDLMTARQRVLDDLGYAEGWRLLAPGERLRGLYHECDLLIAETARAGLFENCEPATLAGVLSSFVFEARRARNKGPHQNTPTKKKRVRNDRLGDHRRGDITERLREIAALATHVTTVEEAYRVPHVRDVDGGFASTIAAWVRGAPLATVLELAEIDAGFLSPGDFVRNAKQVADLCEQVARWGSGDLVAVASETREAILRSIVASASVHPL